MTVKELINKLETLDPNMIVVLNGYEAGADEVYNVAVVDIVLNYNTKFYYGPHEYANHVQDLDKYKTVSAVKIW